MCLVDRNSIWALVMFLYKEQGNGREVLGCVILPLLWKKEYVQKICLEDGPRKAVRG